MDFVDINGVKIYRPSSTSELKFRRTIENNFRREYSTGIYDNLDEINKIIHYNFEWLEEQFMSSLKKISSRQLLEFIFFQIDQWWKIYLMDRNDDIPYRFKEWVREYLPISRRTLNFIVERIVQLGPIKELEIQENKLMIETDKLIIAGEQLIRMSMLSNQTYMLFPTKTTLKVEPIGSENYFNMYLTDEFKDKINEFKKEVQLHTSINEKFSHYYSIRFDDLIPDFLDNALKSTLEVTIEEIRTIVTAITGICKSESDNFDVPFCLKEDLFNNASKLLDISPETIERVISGLLLTKEKLNKENRQVFKPKQEYRLIYRPFVEMPHKLGKHLCWSKTQVKYSLINTFKKLCYRKTAPEWESSELKQCQTKLSHFLSDEFEDVCKKSLQEKDWETFKSLKTIHGKDEQRIDIEKEVGEIDLISISLEKRILLVGECKAIEPSTGPVFFRDDKTDFLRGEDSYYKKFKKKVQWVKNNIEHILAHFEKFKNIKIENPEIKSIFITKYPNISETFITDIPMKSLKVFVYDLDNSSKWPY